MDANQDKIIEQKLSGKELIEKFDFLNISLGLERCLNDEEFYLDILDAFVEENLLDELKGLYLESNWTKYRIRVHTLKSSAAYIGADELSARAKRMEMAAKEGNDEYIHRKHYNLMGYYEEILRQIDKRLTYRDKQSNRAQMERFKLLIVDDNQLSRKEARDILDNSFQVEEAISGKEMYQKLSAGFVPDLILLDIYMPQENGHVILQELRQDEHYQDIPVAFMTSDDSSESVAQSFKEGAIEYLVKPLQEDIVIARVNRVLQLTHLRKNLQHEVRIRTKADKEKSHRMAVMFDQIVQALANTIDAKDKYTKGHSERVSKYAIMIADNLQFTEEQLTHLRYAGILHDIGKIGIPDSIINKPEPLTEEEYNIIKQHPVIGAEILHTITSVPDIAQGAHWHHERYDGHGYPDGLKGINIPEVARILAVADAYDSMTSGRAFRPRMTQGQVKQEIANGLGTQFDPVYGNIMLEIISRDTNFDLQEK